MTRSVRRIVLTLSGGLVFGAAYLGLEHVTGNVHTVIAGELYRSGTLSPAALQALVDERGIRTIINLRGRHPDHAWWRGEEQIAERNGIELIDLGWSASKPLSDKQVTAFYAAIDAAPKPVLIHCMSGSDRSGLASALYLAHRLKSDEETAEGQLSIVYGHIGLPFFPAEAMDDTFERLEPSLGYYGS
nr:tyrosine-protein phosphatase [Jiella mangrovi]